MDQPPIQIYAELLHNIHTISLLITLSSVSNTQTSATLSADGSSLTVVHDGHSASIVLPTQMQGGGTATLQLPAAPAKELTLRLQLKEKEPGLLKLEEHNGGNEVPWGGSEMTLLESGLECGSCSAELVARETVKEWRDLPSEDWAEMMDLWHCHKPHDDETKVEEAGETKGYAAGNRLRVDKGTGFISLSYFLVAKEDSKNVKVR